MYAGRGTAQTIRVPGSARIVGASRHIEDSNMGVVETLTQDVLDLSMICGINRGIVVEIIHLGFMMQQFETLRVDRKVLRDWAHISDRNRDVFQFEKNLRFAAG